MDEITKLVLIYGVIPGVIGIGTYMIRSLIQRLEVVENALHRKVEEPQVRQQLLDKIEPLREDIQEIRAQLDHIIKLLMRK